VSDEDDSREDSIEENHARKGRKGIQWHSKCSPENTIVTQQKPI
jgi:hypothetical protein